MEKLDGIVGIKILSILTQFLLLCSPTFFWWLFGRLKSENSDADSRKINA